MTNVDSGTPCNFFWGSHGCDLLFGHLGVHQCGTQDPDGGLCSQYAEGTSDRGHKVRFLRQDDTWDEWMDDYPEGWRQ